MAEHPRQVGDVTGGSIAERALRRDRVLVVCGLLAVVVLSWAYLLTGAGTMWMAVFADVGASLLVVGNGLRLLRMDANK